ncbi:hypothetical protein ACFQ0M_43020 [Kitasatospora aburaviensis]
MRITQADLDEFFWLHREIQIMARTPSGRPSTTSTASTPGCRCSRRLRCRPANRTPPVS